MSPSLVVSLAPGVRLQLAADGAPLLQRDPPTEGTRRLSPLVGILAALLSEGAVSYDALTQVATEIGGDHGLAEWYVTLPRLLSEGVAQLSVVDEDGTLVTLTHLLDTAVIDFAPLPGDARWTLSRFAFLHNERGSAIVTSAATGARLRVDRAIVATFLHAACDGGTVATWSARLAGALATETVEALVALFVAAGVIVPLEDGVGRERPSLVEWELADALLHHRSRLGRHDDPIGATYPFRGERAPADAVKPAMSARAIPLERPDLGTLAGDDLPFTQVVERRRSLRRHGSNPITLAELGDFLYRSARVRASIPPDDKAPYATTSRPYPGGGAAYELEVYVVAGSCEALARGLYHYAPDRHCLEPLDVPEADIETWLADARMPVDQWGERQLLILIAARFRRVTWKYRAIAYATVLKDVGVLLQTMSLVATAMGLAACPLGAGDGTRLARAIGTDYFEESTVGELTLGSTPDDP